MIVLVALGLCGVVVLVGRLWHDPVDHAIVTVIFLVLGVTTYIRPLRMIARRNDIWGVLVPSVGEYFFVAAAGMVSIAVVNGLIDRIKEGRGKC